MHATTRRFTAIVSGLLTTAALALADASPALAALTVVSPVEEVDYISPSGGPHQRRAQPLTPSKPFSSASPPTTGATLVGPQLRPPATTAPRSRSLHDNAFRDRHR